MKNSIETTMRLICIGTLCAFALLGISGAIMQVTFTSTLGYGENTILVSAWGLLNGHDLYSSAEIYNVPSFLAIYPPIYYLMVAVGIKLWGISHIPGRLVAMICALGSAAMIALIAQKRGANRFGAIIGTATFLCALPVMYWCRYLRSDFPAIFFELAAVYILLGGMTTKRMALFVLFALIAGFTKQTEFALVIGALIGFSLEGDKRRKKRVLITFMLYVISAFTVFALIQILTNGGFYQAVVVSSLISMGGKRLVEKSIKMLLDPMDIILISLGFVGAFSKKHRRFMVPFLLAPMISAIGSTGKTGSNINYFLEVFCALCVGAALLAGERDSEPDTFRRYKKAIVCSLLIIGVIGSTITRVATFSKWYRELKILEKYHETPESVVFMKRHIKPGSLIYAQHSQLPLFADCVPVLSDPFNITDMIRIGKWDQSALIRAIKNQEIALVLMGEQVTTSVRMEFMSEDVARAVLDNYTLIRNRPDDYFTYVPNNAIRRKSPLNK